MRVIVSGVVVVKACCFVVDLGGVADFVKEWIFLIFIVDFCFAVVVV